MIINLTIRLQDAVGEAVTSMDIKAYSLAPGDRFDENFMEDTYGSASESVGELVSGTTELGLTRCIGNQTTLLVKPKVILRTALSRE